MAEKIIFGADIDNVTIKNINGKLTVSPQTYQKVLYKE